MKILAFRQLEKDLAEDSLSSWEKTKYLIFVSIIHGLYGPLFMITPKYGVKLPLLNTFLTLASTTVLVFVIYFGIRRCYETNKTIDDDRFIERFAVLYVPWIMVFTIIGIPATFVIGFFIVKLFPAQSDRLQFYPVALHAVGIIMMYLLYMLLNGSFKRLKSIKSGHLPNKAL